MAWAVTENKDKAHKLETLSCSERKAYRHLFAGYSEAWTAETLGLEEREATRLFAGLYRKLGVAGPRELILSYAPDEPPVNRVLKPKGLR